MQTPAPANQKPHDKQPHWEQRAGAGIMKFSLQAFVIRLKDYRWRQTKDTNEFLIECAQVPYLKSHSLPNLYGENLLRNQH